MPDSVEQEGTGDETGTATPTESPQFAGETPRPVSEGTVQIAYCHETRVSHSFCTSLLTMYADDKSVGPDNIVGAPIQVACSGPHGLVEGRNDAVRMFLDDGLGAEWLFWIDTDMGFQGDALHRLMQAADPKLRPVVGGLCFALKMTEADGFGGFHVAPVPTLFGLARDPEGRIGFANRSIYSPNTLTQVAGTGSAFILIHRSVLEAIREKHGDEWYSLISYEDGRHISEDLSFCWRVGDVGAPIYVHTGIRTTHHKELWVSEGDYHQPEVDPVFNRTAPKMVMP